MSDISEESKAQSDQFQESPSDQELQKPKKKIKKQRSPSQGGQDSQGHKKKHKKHKKSKSKHKKHKEKSEKKQKKQKDKKSKHKKDHKKSQKQQSQLQSEIDSSQLASSLEKKNSKRSKSNTSAKNGRLKTPSRIKRFSKSKVKKQAIVSASEDEAKPIELQKSSEESDSEKPAKTKEKTQKKRRGRKPRSQPEDKSQAQNFDIDDVINLEDQEESKRDLSTTSKERASSRPKKQIDRLMKIKQPVIKNIIVTKNVENVPVDHHFSKFNECHVFEMGGCFYNATLTQSNIVRDDNKFFIIQILQMNHNEEEFYVYSRWGRVGVTGQISQLGPLNRQSSIRHYNQVVQNKIKIGHYKVVQMNYDDYDKNKKDKGNKQLQISSKLDPRVQQLIKLIFDTRMMNSHMREIGYDEKKLPLGKLGQKAITQGYNILNKLLVVINDKTKESFEKKKQMNELSGLFYQCIPHDFGYINMASFVLDTDDKVKQKLQILSSLQQIQIYNSLINQRVSNPELSEIDQKYYRLGVTISPIIKGSQIWKKLIKYVQNTHAKTHNKYDLEVQQIFELKKEQMDIAYKKQIRNKRLLWHGSRLTNYVGILSKGLKIAPLQAPSTGYMFGKGIYFADMVSKSANYCLATRANNIGLVLLCQVACGESNQKFAADFQAANLPKGFHSTKGMGQLEPNEGQFLDGDIHIPNGKSNLLYNEYVVYDPRQIRYRYLFRFKFHFKVTENILPGIRV